MWVNLIQDTLAALALATDSPSSAVLDRKPEPKKAPLITATMWKMIIGQSVYQLGITLLLHYGGDRIFRYHTTHEKDQLATTVFNTYVWMQSMSLPSDPSSSQMQTNPFDQFLINTTVVVLITSSIFSRECTVTGSSSPSVSS